MEVQLSRAEKLEALVRKAFENGWEGFGHCRGAVLPWYIVSAGQMPTPKVVESWVPDNSLLIAGIDDYYFVWQTVIFDADFARALFGEKTERLWKCPACGYSFEWYKHNEDNQYCPSDGRKLKDTTEVAKYEEHPWQHHLQQAVISHDPIDCMYKEVFGDE